LNPESPVARFLEKRGEGMHHMAFRVDDIQSRLHQLQQAGIQLIHERPKIGAGGNWVAFLHPRSTGGVLVELCEPRSKGMEA
jgi:methylmalonyl-CoA/ethylmalonyl-CoA epimerase